MRFMLVWRNCLLYFFIISVSCVSTGVLFKHHATRQVENISSISLLPVEITELISLEFKGLLSDYLMLDALTYMGGKLMRRSRLTKKECGIVYLALKQIINLDPRSSDPYVIAETTLPWDGGLVQEANEILLNAARMRPHDPRPYFFLWYNYFSFLNDPQKAGFYLQKAAKIPGAPSYYAALASRMDIYAGKLYGAIAFLGEIIKETEDPALKKYLLLREEALRKMLFLEQRVAQFVKKFGRKPKRLEELLNTGLLDRLPKDPYGGTFYLRENGRVYTTSKLTVTEKK